MKTLQESIERLFQAFGVRNEYRFEAYMRELQHVSWSEVADVVGELIESHDRLPALAAIHNALGKRTRQKQSEARKGEEREHNRRFDALEEELGGPPESMREGGPKEGLLVDVSAIPDRVIDALNYVKGLPRREQHALAGEANLTQIPFHPCFHLHTLRPEDVAASLCCDHTQMRAAAAWGWKSQHRGAQGVS